MAYLTLFSFTIIIFSFIKDNNKIKNMNVNLPFIFLVTIMFILFYGLRYNVGIDYMTYYNNAANKIYDLPQKGTGELFEPAFRLLYRIADFFDLPSNTIFIFGGAIIYIFLVLACLENSINIGFSIFIFFSSGLFFFSFNEFRQFIAVCIIFYAYKYCIRKKFFIWILHVFIAMLFHKSAFVVFPMYFLCNIRYKKVFINLLLLSTIILKRIGVLSILCLILSFLPPPYCNYWEVLPYMITEGGSGIVGYCYIIIALFINNLLGKEQELSQKDNFFFNLFIFSTMFLNIFSNIYMITRLMEYYFTSILIIYPFFYKASKKGLYKYIFFILMTLFFFINFSKYAFFPPSTSKLTYHTVFSKPLK